MVGAFTTYSMLVEKCGDPLPYIRRDFLLGYLFPFVSSISRKSHLFRKMTHGHSQAATEALLTDPVMSAFLWPEAVSALRNMPKLTQGSQHPVQLAVALEVHLSILASLDAQLPGSTSWFQTLLPTVKL